VCVYDMCVCVRMMCVCAYDMCVCVYDVSMCCSSREVDTEASAKGETEETVYDEWVE